MVSVEILDRESVTYESPEYLRIKEVVPKLQEAGFSVSCFAWTDTSCAAAKALIEKKGQIILPITVVNNFPMITGRYPSNDELKQLLNVPDGILEPKVCGCCCIEGCGDCGR